MGEPRAFAWAPGSGNVLRERERHIALLEGEVGQKDTWLRRFETDQASLQTSHEELLAELKERNEWAESLNAELLKSGQTIAQLQAELEAAHAGYQARVRQLEEELGTAHAGYQERVRQLEATHRGYQARLGDLEREIEGIHAGYREHLRGLEKELEDAHGGYQKHVRELELESAERLDWGQRLEQELTQRTRWAQSLDAKLTQAEAQLHLTARSKWVRLGRLLRLGPEITGSDGQPG